MYGQNLNYNMYSNTYSQNGQFFFANGRWFYTYNMGVYTYPENYFVGPISSPTYGYLNNNGYFYNLDKVIMNTSLPKSVEDLFNSKTNNCNCCHNRSCSGEIQPAPVAQPAPVVKSEPAPVFVKPAPAPVVKPEPAPAPAPEPVVVQPAPAPEPVVVQPAPAPVMAPEPAPMLDPEPPTEMFAEFEKLIEESLKSGKKDKKSAPASAAAAA
ncbi:hypothetical protein [Spiroplasma alleghenense]|uniref:Uncharacterized protein n=1 Tax=Spiroplasma alleghenense TaxID=216931 RepID=A0A345Z471_9MOLU|nr:hypothetical protein [Spiroplasma alleghenense]AXK51400.1 hypothetical protein SALLE_v1c07300 [Spiroplasma alleghenense]